MANIFIPVSRIFNNKDDIFLFSRIVLKDEKYYEMRRKIINNYCLYYLNDLFGIKLIILRSELNVATF